METLFKYFSRRVESICTEAFDQTASTPVGCVPVSEQSAIPVRRKPLLVAAVLLCFLCGSWGVKALADKKFKAPRQTRRAETRLIENLEEQWRTALINADASAMEKLISEDFLAISARGTLSNKQQYLQRITNRATQMSAIELLDLQVRVQPASAVAVSQARVSGVLEGRPIQGTFRYTKVYQRSSAGTWRITNFEATRVSPGTSALPNDMDRGTPLQVKPTTDSTR
ncbi:MAG: nuclear transport factor 2 family protein [Janthinobacterium lividum]